MVVNAVECAELWETLGVYCLDPGYYLNKLIALSLHLEIFLTLKVALSNVDVKGRRSPELLIIT